MKRFAAKLGRIVLGIAVGTVALALAVLFWAPVALAGLVIFPLAVVGHVVRTLILESRGRRDPYRAGTMTVDVPARTVRIHRTYSTPNALDGER